MDDLAATVAQIVARANLMASRMPPEVRRQMEAFLEPKPDHRGYPVGYLVGQMHNANRTEGMS